MCVRLVQMNGVDLRLFQFDYDQTFAAFFLNADGTIYGRFGTRAGNGPNSTTHVSVASFKKALERALAEHRGYPENRVQLAGKLGAEPEYRLVRSIPGLEDRPQRVEGRDHGCVHCHQVRENPLRQKWQNGRLTAADLWVHPLPENTGMKMEVDDGLRVASVTPGSPAARAGIQPRDELRTLDGQPLLSQADIQWVLHRAPVECRLPAALTRSGKSLAVTLVLGGSWKEGDLSWRASSGAGLRYGVWSTPLPAPEREKHNIPPGGMALEVKSLFTPRAAPAQQAGLRPGDVIVGVDGKTDLLTETRFLVHARLNHPPGDRVRLTVQRAGQRIELPVPMW